MCAALPTEIRTEVEDLRGPEGVFAWDCFSLESSISLVSDTVSLVVERKGKDLIHHVSNVELNGRAQRYQDSGLGFRSS